tara:strand:+ start:413 stop:712 length:300 start_codon:yes stop_codon:yes gene_type:complete
MFESKLDFYLPNYEFFLFICILLVCTYIIINLYKKVKIYEAWTNEVRERVSKLQQDIKEVDTRGIFENDDDVGFIYEEISSLINNLDHGLVEEETTKEK